MFSAPIKADLDATLHCIARSTGTWERGTFPTQVKNVVYRDQSRIVDRAFTTIGKQTTNHAK